MERLDLLDAQWDANQHRLAQIPADTAWINDPQQRLAALHQHIEHVRRDLAQARDDARRHFCD